MGVGPKSGSCVRGAWGSWGQSWVRQLGLVAWLALSPPGFGGWRREWWDPGDQAGAGGRGKERAGWLSRGLVFTYFLSW